MGGIQLPELSLSSLAAMIIFSTIGFWLFKQGRQRLDFRLVCVGIVMMGYTYFTHGAWQDWGGGILLCGAAYYIWNYL